MSCSGCSLKCSTCTLRSSKPTLSYSADQIHLPVAGNPKTKGLISFKLDINTLKYILTKTFPLKEAFLRGTKGGCGCF